jgi:hypothetical protein
LLLLLLDLRHGDQLEKTASLNYRSACGKSRTSTLKFACLFDAVRWVIKPSKLYLETLAMNRLQAFYLLDRLAIRRSPTPLACGIVRGETPHRRTPYPDADFSSTARGFRR